jgi:hypothetical protein
MNKSSFASSEERVYRLNSLYWWYHLVIGAVFLVVSALARDLWFISIPIALFAAFMVARPFTTAVIVDQHSVTLKRMFSKNSLLRSSITAIERVPTGKGTLLVLWGNIEEKEQLAIAVNLFAFDEAWDDWLKSYRDISGDKPLSLF